MPLESVHLSQQSTQSTFPSHSVVWHPIKNNRLSMTHISHVVDLNVMMWNCLNLSSSYDLHPLNSMLWDAPGWEASNNWNNVVFSTIHFTWSYVKLHVTRISTSDREVWLNYNSHSYLVLATINIKAVEFNTEIWKKINK